MLFLQCIHYYLIYTFIGIKSPPIQFNSIFISMQSVFSQWNNLQCITIMVNGHGLLWLSLVSGYCSLNYSNKIFIVFSIIFVWYLWNNCRWNGIWFSTSVGYSVFSNFHQIEIQKFTSEPPLFTLWYHNGNVQFIIIIIRKIVFRFVEYCWVNTAAWINESYFIEYILVAVFCY